MALPNPRRARATSFHRDWVITDAASVLNDGAASLLNRANSGLSYSDVSLAHPSLADKAEWTLGEDLGSDHLQITIELR